MNSEQLLESLTDSADWQPCAKVLGLETRVYHVGVEGDTVWGKGPFGEAFELTRDEFLGLHADADWKTT
jgi:hypothetical protein